MSQPKDLQLWREDPGIGRAVVIGCAVGAIVAFAGIATAALVGGLGAGAALGLGVFGAGWGGLGFGGMMGGVAGFLRSERIDRAGAERR